MAYIGKIYIRSGTERHNWGSCEPTLCIKTLLDIKHHSRNYITMTNDGGSFKIQTAGKKARILGCFLEINFNGNTCFRYTAGYFNRC